MRSTLIRNLGWAALMGSPYAVMTALVVVSTLSGPGSPEVGWTALGVAVLTGSVGVWQLTKGRWTRVGAVLIYMPTAFVTAIWWTLVFGCSAYGQCP
jgi:hypothetical protein